MLEILLGPDDFSKKEYLNSLAEKHRGEVEHYFGQEAVPDLAEIAQQSLFSKPKVFVLESLPAQYGEKEAIDKLVSSPNYVVLAAAKLDKRSSSAKRLLDNEKVAVKNFSLPHGKELDRWIEGRVKSYGGEITASAVNLLAEKLGRDDAIETKAGGKVIEVKEIFSLWQADNEIKKLLSCAGNNPITDREVEELACSNGEVDTLEIVNAIADGKKAESLNLLHRFLQEGSGTDEKGEVIRLNALLSEQFRTVAITQDLTARNLSDDKIIGITSWKPGRLFIMKKIASRFDRRKVMQLLDKLEHLDEELKTANTPPRVLLDLIMAQFFDK